MIPKKVKKTKSGLLKIKPTNARQADTYSNKEATLAIDGDLNTSSQTTCGWGITKWFKLYLGGKVCLNEVSKI